MIKNLKNGEKAVLLDDLTTINGIIWPKGTIIIMHNLLNVTATLITPKVECEHTDFPIYYKAIIKSEAMYTNIKEQ